MLAMAINLTPRETQVRDMLCAEEAPTSKQIAATLGISSRTVEAYRDRVLLKYRAKNTIQLLYRVLAERGVI